MDKCTKSAADSDIRLISEAATVMTVACTMAGFFTLYEK